MSITQRRLPVTVVTGFLGAGKTTLLRQLLLHSGQRLAVVVNEFGEVGIDGALIRSCGFCPDEELDARLIELANGCLCCTVQDDFLPTMECLLARADRLDGIVVETSGLALPEPLVAAFGWPQIRSRTRVHAVVTVVDGEALAGGHVVADPQALEAQRQADPSLDHSDAIDELFGEQLRAADVVLISRADLLQSDQLETVAARLQARCRPGLPVLPMAAGRVDADLLLGTSDDGGSPRPSPSHDHDHDHDHSHVAIETVALTLHGHWSQVQLEAKLRQLITEHRLIRVKGWLAMPGKQRLLQIQAVGPRLDCWYEGRQNPPTCTSDRGELQLVVLGFQLDRNRMEQQLSVESDTPNVGMLA